MRLHQQANLAKAKDSVPAVCCVRSVVKGQDQHILTAKHFVNSLALAGIQQEHMLALICKTQRVGKHQKGNLLGTRKLMPIWPKDSPTKGHCAL